MCTRQHMQQNALGLSMHPAHDASREHAHTRHCFKGPLTMRVSALNSILALQLPHSTTFLSRAPLMVRMSPKYCCASLPQLGHGPCSGAGHHYVQSP